MAVQVFTNAQVKINNVDLSTWVSDVTLDMTLVAVEVTAMGAGGKQYLQGLEDSKFDVSFWQDFAASAPAQTLIAIRNAGTAVAFSIIPSGTVPSSTNPRLTGNAILTDYPIVAGKVGDALASKATFQISGTITSGSV